MDRLVKILPSIIAIIGIGVFTVGVVTYFELGTDNKASNIGFSPSVIERQAAMNGANERGEKTYEYQSNFIPGIGRVGAAEQLRDQILKPLE